MGLAIIIVGVGIGALIGGYFGLVGRLAYDYWGSFPPDFDYGAGVFGIAGAVIGAPCGALIGLWLAAERPVFGTRYRPAVLAAGTMLLLVAAGLLTIPHSPRWRAKHWGRGAYLVYANLAHLNLRGIDLTCADMSEADLTGADLRDADLAAARLGAATLVGADLRGAKMVDGVWVDADLTGVNLSGALYDCRTRWPKGFDPEQHGARLVR